MTTSTILRLKAVLAFFLFSFCITITGHSQSCPTQGTEIFPDLSGQELIDALVEEYKTTVVLSYNDAREEMYGNIDNVDGFVEGIYTGYKGAIDPAEGDVRGQANDLRINAEHGWPQSKGATSGTLGHSDMHHLYPAFSSANSSRGNHPFAEIPDDETEAWWLYDQQYSTPQADSIDFYSERKEGHPSGLTHPGTNGSDYDSWEPRESVEGDISRSIFYFYTMYKDLADDADPVFFEIQKEFLRTWNSLDSVSTREYNRTCAIAEFQDSKVNPFVIDPTLVERAYFEGQVSQTNVFFSASILNLSEGQSTLDIEVSITNPNPDTATTVDVMYAGGTATPGQDFESISTQTLTFSPGSLERQSFSINIIDDEMEETDETILLDLQNVSGPQQAVIAEPDSTEITLRDNDGEIVTTAWVNEFHYDNESTDEGEFVEIAVRAEFADLSNVNLTLYNGSNGTLYATYSGNDFELGNTQNGISFYYVDLPSNGLQNGSPDGLSLDIDGELIQFLSYEGTFTAEDGPAQDVGSTDIGAEQTGTTPAGSSLQLTGSGSEYADFSWIYTEEHTKGEVNTEQEILTPVANEFDSEIASHIQLKQNYPNPFNPSTIIGYQLSESSVISLKVYDMLGREVATLVNNKRQAAGSHYITFEAGELSSGVYIYRISTSNSTQITKKMLLMK
jgi:endonuclease I